MAKRRNTPNDNAKKFKNGKKNETPNVMRGDVANLSDILGSYS